MKLGWTYWMEWVFGWTQDPRSLGQALEFAQKAISLDDNLPEAHCLVGGVLLWERRHEEAIAIYETVIDTHPNYADGYANLGDILTWAGRPEEAIRLIKKAMRLNPRYPSHYLWNLGHAYYIAERYREAIDALRRLLIHKPGFLPAHIYLAAMYSELGQEERAKLEVEKIWKIEPGISSDLFRERVPYKDQAVLARLFDSLRQAGIE
jgi:adenylate cyclase